jgi:hypothetical protein
LKLFISTIENEHGITTSSFIKLRATAGQDPSSAVVLFPYLQLTVFGFPDLEVDRAYILDTPVLEEGDFELRMKVVRCCFLNMHLVVAG